MYVNKVFSQGRFSHVNTFTIICDDNNVIIDTIFKKQYEHFYLDPDVQPIYETNRYLQFLHSYFKNLSKEDKLYNTINDEINRLERLQNIKLTDIDMLLNIGLSDKLIRERREELDSHDISTAYISYIKSNKHDMLSNMDLRDERIRERREELDNQGISTRAYIPSGSMQKIYDAYYESIMYDD
jgi:hypothetical protein